MPEFQPLIDATAFYIQTLAIMAMLKSALGLTAFMVSLYIFYLIVRYLNSHD